MLNVMSIIIGLKLRDFPIILGSIKFPTRTWEINNVIKRNKELIKSSFCINENRNGRITAINEPIKGTKFKGVF